MDDTVDRAPAEPAQTPRQVSLEGEARDERLLKALFDQSATTEQRAAQKRLRESEERLRLILANSPDTIVYSDRSLRVTEVFNPHAPFLADAMIGKTERDFLPPEEAERFLALRESVLTTGNSARQELSVSLGGSVHWYDATFQPLRDNHGELVGVVTYRRDITERKRAEHEQQRLNRALRLVTTCSGNGRGDLNP
jgi:PAS domain S-box-containing protein